MSRTTLLILFGFVFFLPHCFVLANIEINEIMYDLKTGSDDGREWIEIYNNSDVTADLSTFKLFEADTNHKLVVVSGDSKLQAESYAIIVSTPEKFGKDFPNFSGVILDSTFSLSNSGENLVLKDGDIVVDQYSYKSSSGAAGDGKSLQKINGMWIAASPTPGAPARNASHSDAGGENKIIFVPSPASPKVTISEKVSTKQSIPKAEEIKTTTTTETSAPLSDFSANVFSSDAVKENNNSYIFQIILVVFLTLSSIFVYSIRKRKVIPNSAENFEILD